MRGRPRPIRPIQVTTGRHPFQVAVLAASLVVGLALIASDLQPRSVVAAMSGPIRLLWEFQLAAAGVVGLMGIYWPGRLQVRLWIELCGVVVLGTATTMYALALYAVSGTAAIAAGAFVAALAVAAWWRVGQIIRDLRRMARAAESGTTAEVSLLIEDPDR
jgi:hypothetical protein